MNHATTRPCIMPYERHCERSEAIQFVLEAAKPRNDDVLCRGYTWSAILRRVNRMLAMLLLIGISLTGFSEASEMETSPTTNWVIGFVTTAETLPTGAVRLTLDNGQVGIVENPENVRYSFLLKPQEQDGFYNEGVAFRKNEQDVITEIRDARIRVRIYVRWKQPKFSLVRQHYEYRNHEKRALYQKDFLAIGVLPTPTDYELHPALPGFAEFRRIAEEAKASTMKDGKPVDIVFGDNPSEIIHIQYSQSAFKNPPGTLHAFPEEE